MTELSGKAKSFIRRMCRDEVYRRPPCDELMEAGWRIQRESPLHEGTFYYPLIQKEWAERATREGIVTFKTCSKCWRNECEFRQKVKEVK